MIPLAFSTAPLTFFVMGTFFLSTRPAEVFLTRGLDVFACVLGVADFFVVVLVLVLVLVVVKGALAGA